MPNNTVQSKPANRPVFETRHGNIKVLVWQNESRNGPMFNVTISRLYKDGDTWKESHSFGHDDLPVLALVCQEVYFWVRGQNTA